MPVGELLARTTSRELTEWMVFYEMDPFGLERGDLRAGIVASVIANANRDSKKQKKVFTPQDFLPDFGQSKRGGEGAPSPDELKRKFMRVAAALGGRKSASKK